jgi:hypothetical protein
MSHHSAHVSLLAEILTRSSSCFQKSDRNWGHRLHSIIYLYCWPEILTRLLYTPLHLYTHHWLGADEVSGGVMTAGHCNLCLRWCSQGLWSDTHTIILSWWSRKEVKWIMWSLEQIVLTELAVGPSWWLIAKSNGGVGMAVKITIILFNSSVEEAGHLCRYEGEEEFPVTSCGTFP